MIDAIYNEIEPFAAQWIAELARQGHIAPGRIEQRSIADLQPSDVAGPGQRHFFAGIGGWSYALRLAGIPDDANIWTGSCPCQPFSDAGRKGGVNDERHLWPAWFRLIQACRPPVIFGEQVASSEVIGQQGERSGVPASLSTNPQGEGFDSSRAATRSGEESGLRLGPVLVGDPSAHQQGDLRGYGIAAQSRWRSHLGQSLVGQDCPCCGLPLREHADRLPCGEWSDGRLGRADRDRHGARDPRQAQSEIRRVVDSLGRAFAEADGGPWIDLVQSDLESAGYSVGFAVLPAAGVGAPHIRQRLYFVAYANTAGRGELGRARLRTFGNASQRDDADGCGSARGFGDTSRNGDREHTRIVPSNEGEHAIGAAHRDHASVAAGAAGDVVNAEEERRGSRRHGESQRWSSFEPDRSGAAFWSDAEWLPCTDGVSRPVEPGTFPLAHGIPGRVGRLRGYGNAIVPQVAACFIEAAFAAWSEVK